jgi:hypothetical protein
MAAAGTRAARTGTTGFAAIGATATGFGNFAITTSRTDRDGTGTGGAGRRGASTDRNVIGSVEGNLNTAIDRGRGVDAFSDARVGTTAVSTPAKVACTTTLSHKPVLEREPEGARVLNRASLNKSDMCRTDLKCRSVLLRRAAVCGVRESKRSADVAGHRSYCVQSDGANSKAPRRVFVIDRPI